MTMVAAASAIAGRAAAARTRSAPDRRARVRFCELPIIALLLHARGLRGALANLCCGGRRTGRMLHDDAAVWHASGHHERLQLLGHGHPDRTAGADELLWRRFALDRRRTPEPPGGG